jgi:hypothetical protein
MNLTGGFEVVLELTISKLRELMLSQLVSSQPGFTLPYNIPEFSQDGFTFNLVLGDLYLLLEYDDSISILSPSVSYV